MSLMWWWIPVLLQAYSCSADGTVRLWDFTDGILIKVRLLPSIVVCPVLSVSVSSQSAHHTFYFLSVRVFSFFIINQLLWNWIISATVPLLHYIWLAACDQIMKDKKKYIFKHNLGHSPISLWVKNLKYAVKQTLIRLFNTVMCSQKLLDIQKVILQWRLKGQDQFVMSDCCVISCRRMSSDTRFSPSMHLHTMKESSSSSLPCRVTKDLEVWNLFHVFFNICILLNLNGFCLMESLSV